MAKRVFQHATAFTEKLIFHRPHFGSARHQGLGEHFIDIGNAESAMTASMPEGVPQADGRIAVEPVMDVANVARSVLHMASLPLDANVQFMTVMATAMPYIGRG